MTSTSDRTRLLDSITGAKIKVFGPLETEERTEFLGKLGNWLAHGVVTYIDVENRHDGWSFIRYHKRGA